MKLESLDEMESERQFFCWSCGNRLNTVDEISQRICFSCKKKFTEMKEEEVFFCWACGKQLLQMSEVAQGLCHNCKSAIIRKIQKPTKKLSILHNKK